MNKQMVRVLVIWTEPNLNVCHYRSIQWLTKPERAPAVPDRQLSSAVWQFGDTSGNQFVEEWQGVIRAEYQSKSWETQTTSSDPTLYHTMT